MKFINLENKWFVGPLFFFLFTYLILRAWFIEPMLDELGTYYWYIQTGLLPGHGAVMDSNNHVLNSFISNKLYNSFGDHFFLFRLLAIAGFPVYFFACRRLILKIKMPFQSLVFLALISVHWIFDYFSLSRGYGPELGFLMLGFCYLVEWNKTLKAKYFLFVILTFIVVLLSNFSVFIPILFLFGYLVLTFVMRIRQLSIGQIILIAVSIMLFISFMIPVYIYLNKLKKAGALWWGSTAGLWEVTGKSLSKNVFFCDNDFLKYTIILLLIISAAIFLFNWKKSGFVNFLFQYEFWIPGLLFLCLVSFVFMAEIMKVNYPMDRVGMYLVPLFILVAGISASTVKAFRWALLLLLWFPVSFLWKMNLNTTIFSPEDRMRSEFYENLMKHISADETVSIDYVQHTCYAYMSRKEKIAHLAISKSDDSLSLGDYHVSWTEELTNPDYSCIYTDTYSKTRLYKRKKSLKKMLILDTVIASVHSQELKIPFVDLNLNGKYNQVQTIVEGSVHLKESSLGLNLTHEIIQQDQASRLFQPSPFDWYFGRKLNYSFNYPNQVFQLTPSDGKLSIFMMNNDFKEVQMSKIRIRIYSISPQ